jgi:para-aminobenzoate synthetase component 1
LKRVSQKYITDDAELLKKKLSAFAQQFQHFCILESNTIFQIQEPIHQQYDALFAIDSLAIFKQSSAGMLDEFRHFVQEQNDWVFGTLSYDVKNHIEKLSSEHTSSIQHELLSFFVPRHLVLQRGNEFELLTQERSSDFFDSVQSTVITHENLPELTFQPSLTVEEYTRRFKQIQEHIQKGDIYEMNFCFDFTAKSSKLEGQSLWNRLTQKTHAPMSAYVKDENLQIFCASPERYLQKQGSKVIAQPIKGTARREADPTKDAQVKQGLKYNIKEQNENVMIVDLMRNDLSKFALRRTVQVQELFGVYTFGQVHQLISTIQCEAKPEVDFVDILKASFPMGSMTGAPKVRAMEIIESLEPMQRGLYSGSIGYIAPNGDFDFNVVIRTLMYDTESGVMSYSAGSAITAMANASEEYQECLLKAKVINELFQ